MSDPVQGHAHEPADEELVWWARWLDVLVTFWKLWLIVALVVGLVVIGLLNVVGWTWPREVKLAALTTLIAAPYGYLVILKVRDIWPAEPYVYGVEFRIEDTEAGGIWRWPMSQFRRNGIEDNAGSLDWVHPSLFFARKIDERHKEYGEQLEGTWRGTLEDRELAWSLQKVAQCRGELIDDAARGFVLESSMWVASFRAARNAVEELRDMIEDGTLPDHGEGVDAAVASAISDSGLDELIEDIPGGMDVPEGMGADDDAFADPLGKYTYSEEAQEAPADDDLGAPVDVPEEVDLPDRELSADD